MTIMNVIACTCKPVKVAFRFDLRQLQVLAIEFIPLANEFVMTE